MKKAIITTEAPQAIGPYSQAISFANLLFISGQIHLDKNGTLILGDIRQQTEQCLNNIDQILKCAGTDKNNILKTTIFLRNIADFPIVNEVYGNFFINTIPPARSTVEVSSLPKDAKIEIEVIASI